MHSSTSGIFTSSMRAPNDSSALSEALNAAITSGSTFMMGASTQSMGTPITVPLISPSSAAIVRHRCAACRVVFGVVSGDCLKHARGILSRPCQWPAMSTVQPMLEGRSG